MWKEVTGTASACTPTVVRVEIEETTRRERTLFQGQLLESGVACLLTTCLVILIVGDQLDDKILYQKKAPINNNTKQLKVSHVVPLRFRKFGTQFMIPMREAALRAVKTSCLLPKEARRRFIRRKVRRRFQFANGVRIRAA